MLLFSSLNFSIAIEKPKRSLIPDIFFMTLFPSSLKVCMIFKSPVFWDFMVICLQVVSFHPLCYDSLGSFSVDIHFFQIFSNQFDVWPPPSNPIFRLFVCACLLAHACICKVFFWYFIIQMLPIFVMDIMSYLTYLATSSLPLRAAQTGRWTLFPRLLCRWFSGPDSDLAVLLISRPAWPRCFPWDSVSRHPVFHHYLCEGQKQAAWYPFCSVEHGRPQSSFAASSKNCDSLLLATVTSFQSWQQPWQFRHFGQQSADLGTPSWVSSLVPSELCGKLYPGSV